MIRNISTYGVFLSAELGSAFSAGGEPKVPQRWLALHILLQHAVFSLVVRLTALANFAGCALSLLQRGDFLGLPAPTGEAKGVRHDPLGPQG